jgi:hypothetical protein
MPAEPEALSDGTRSGKEALGVSGGLEPLPVALALTSRLRRILRTVVEIPMLAMFDPWRRCQLKR